MHYTRKRGINKQGKRAPPRGRPVKSIGLLPAYLFLWLLEELLLEERDGALDRENEGDEERWVVVELDLDRLALEDGEKERDENELPRDSGIDR